MPSSARFKPNPGTAPGINLPGLVGLIGDEAGEISRAIYTKPFGDGIDRDVVDVVFPVAGQEVIGLPTEALWLADDPALLPTWS